jgi:hypothetical protein
MKCRGLGGLMINRKFVAQLILFGALSFLCFYFILTPSDSYDHTPSTIPYNTRTTDSKKISEPPSSSAEEASTPPHTAATLTRIEPSHRLEGLFIDHLEKLQQQLKQGDGEAGYILAKNLQGCSFAPVSEVQRDQIIQKVHDKGQDQDGQFISGSHRQQHFCQGIPLALRKQHGDYFRQAAELGFPPAISHHAKTNSSPIFDEQYDTLTGQAKKTFVFEHRKKLITQLEKGARGGDLESMTLLYEFAINDQYTNDGKPVDSIKAYAYMTVFLEFIDDPEIYEIYSQAHRGDLAKLTAQQIGAAEQISAEVIETIYRNGVIYRN